MLLSIGTFLSNSHAVSLAVGADQYVIDILPAAIHDFTRDGSIPAEYTQTVDSTNATFINADGYLEYASAGEGRLDHDPVTGECLGWLFEFQEENLQWYSHRQAFWARSNLGVSRTETDLFGTENNADLVYSTGVGSQVRNTKRSDFDSVAGQTYVVYQIVKADTTDTFLMFTQDGGTNLYCNFDLSDGSIGAYHANLTPFIIPYIQGSYMCGYVFTAANTATNKWGCGFLLTDNTSVTSIFYSTDDTYRSMVFYQGQITAASAPSTPIFTEGATATRTQDQGIITSLDGQSYFNNAEGAVAIRFKPRQADVNTQQSVVKVSKGYGTADHFTMKIDGNGRSFWQSKMNSLSNGDSGQGYNGQGATDSNEVFCGFSWDDTDFTMNYLGSIDTQAMAATPSDFDKLILGGQSPFFFAGHVQKVIFFDERPSTSDMIAPLYEPDRDIVVAEVGQSIVVGPYANSNLGNDNRGEKAMIALAREILPAGKNPIFLNLATNGAAINGDSVGDPLGNWFVDPDEDNAKGAAYIKAETGLKALRKAGMTPKVLTMGQGRSDTTDDLTVFKRDTLTTINGLRTVAGGTSIPVGLHPFGWKKVSDAFNMPVQAYNEIYEELFNVFWLIPWLDQDLTGDTTHPTGDVCEVYCPRNVKVIYDRLGYTVDAPIYAPHFTSADWSGTGVTFNVTHGDGSDVAPSTGVEGFRAFEYDTSADTEGSEIDISSAIRGGATSYDITLDSTPSDGLVVYYGYGAMHTVDHDNVPVDDNGYPFYRAKYVFNSEGEGEAIWN